MRRLSRIEDWRDYAPPHGVLLGANNVGKTAVVEAIALVFGRERVASQVSDWDFFGGSPQPKSRFTIVCTVTDSSSCLVRSSVLLSGRYGEADSQSSCRQLTTSSLPKYAESGRLGLRALGRLA